MKRYDIQAVDNTESVGLEIAEYELGEWCKAEDAITELAAKDARIAELEGRLTATTNERIAQAEANYAEIKAHYVDGEI